jgi:argininosuccinate synthase
LQEQGYDVITMTVDTGGFSDEELEKIGARSRELGAIKHLTIDGKPQLYDQLVSYIIKGNILRGGVYPLSAGPERIVQAAEAVRIAQQEDASVIAHGSTGAGNDQIRFDLTIRVLAPEIEVLTPIRDLAYSRAQSTAYLRERGFAVSEQTKDYSINSGMLGTTIGGKETKGSWEAPPDHVYPHVLPIEQAPDTPETLILNFENGLPTTLNDDPIDGVALMAQLASIGATHGVGKDIHLGDTILGIKGRIGFEAPAILILIKTHRELEKLVLTKNQQFWKDHLATVYGNFLHEALYFDPVMRDIEAMIDSSQQHVTGKVRVKLFKGNIIVEGCESHYSLLNRRVATYGEENALWNGRDAAGFSKIYGLQGVLAHKAAQLAEEQHYESTGSALS